jgi:hypothetical protein
LEVEKGKMKSGAWKEVEQGPIALDQVNLPTSPELSVCETCKKY